MEYELQYSLNLFIRAPYRSNNWTWRPVQTLATLLANKTQHCWAQHVASVCTPYCVLLRVVTTRWKLLDEVWNWSNFIQQLPTSRNNTQQHTIWCANARNMLGPTMLRLVGQQCCERLHGPWHLLFKTTNNTISIDEGLAYELSAVEIFHVDTSEFIDHSMKRAHALTGIRRKRQQGVVRAAWPSR